MKLLTYHLDDLVRSRDYTGMVAAVARHFRLRQPPAWELDVLDKGGWRWNSIIIYQDGFRYAYDRCGREHVRRASFAFDSGVISELDGP